MQPDQTLETVRPGAVRDCAVCLGRGLRDSLRPKLLFLSLGLLLLAVVFWALVFSIFRHDIFRLCVAAVQASVNGVLELGSGSARVDLSPLAAADTSAEAGWSKRLIPYWILAGLIFATAYVGLVLMSLKIALELVLMDRIRPVVRARYPGLDGERPAPLAYKLRGMLGPYVTFILIGGVLLPIPVVNGVGLYLLACYLLVRSALTDALETVADPQETRAVLRGSRWRMLLLGLMLTLLLLVPPLGLLAPVLAGSSAAHLAFRQLARLRAAGESESGHPPATK